MTDETLSALTLSVRVAVLATLANALVGIPLAYLLARRRFRGRALLDLLVTLPLVLPPTVTGYYLIVLLGRRRGSPGHRILKGPFAEPLLLRSVPAPNFRMAVAPLSRPVTRCPW